MQLAERQNRPLPNLAPLPFSGDPASALRRSIAARRVITSSFPRPRAADAVYRHYGGVWPSWNLVLGIHEHAKRRSTWHTRTKQRDQALVDMAKNGHVPWCELPLPGFPGTSLMTLPLLSRSVCSIVSTTTCAANALSSNSSCALEILAVGPATVSRRSGIAYHLWTSTLMSAMLLTATMALTLTLGSFAASSLLMASTTQVSSSAMMLGTSQLVLRARLILLLRWPSTNLLHARLNASLPRTTLFFGVRASRLARSAPCFNQARDTSTVFRSFRMHRLCPHVRSSARPLRARRGGCERMRRGRRALCALCLRACARALLFIALDATLRVVRV
jgi:hypothetical protein